MPVSDKATLDAIERAQTSLRESIKEAKGLAEDSDRLIERHREKTRKG